MITAYIGHIFFQHMRGVYFEQSDILLIQRVVTYDCMVHGEVQFRASYAEMSFIRLSEIGFSISFDFRISIDSIDF